MTKELIALADGQQIGVVRQGPGGKPSFAYAEE
jgi:hypothetical protein